MVFRAKISGHNRFDAIAPVLTALRRIIRAIDQHSHHLAANFGLTGPQLIVLNELAQGGPWSIGALAKAVHLNQATVAGILDRLQRRGHVARQRSDSDRRKVLITLTATGKQTLAEAPAPLQEQFTQAFGRLAEWEQTQILSSLQRLVAMMEATELEATAMLATGPLDVASERMRQYLGDGDSAGAASPPKVPDSESGNASEVGTQDGRGIE